MHRGGGLIRHLPRARAGVARVALPWLGLEQQGSCEPESRKPDGQDGALVGQAGWRRSGVLREQMPLPPPERLVEPLPPPELELLERGLFPGA